MIPGASESESKKKRRNKKKRKSHKDISITTASESIVSNAFAPNVKETDLSNTTVLIIETEEQHELAECPQSSASLIAGSFSRQPVGDEPRSEPEVASEQLEEIKPKPKSVWNDLRRERLEKVGEDRMSLLKSLMSCGLIPEWGHYSFLTPNHAIEAMIDLIVDQSDAKSLMMTQGPPIERNFYILPQEDDDSPITPVPTGMYNQLSLNLCFATSVFQLLLSSHYLVAALTFIARPCYSYTRGKERDERVLGMLLSYMDSTGVFSLSSRNKFLSTGDQQDAAEFLGHTLNELAEMPEFTCSVKSAFLKIGPNGKNIPKNEPADGDKKVSIFTRLYNGSMKTSLPNRTYTEPFNILMVHLDDRHTDLEKLIESTLDSNQSRLDIIPPVLFIQLQRTVYNNGVIHKSTAPVHIPGELRLSRFWMTADLYEYWATDNCDDQLLKEKFTYRLKGVVCHFGNFNDGHYMCYAHRGGGKNPDEILGDCWYACDDTSVVNRFTHNDLNDWTHNGCLFLYEQRGIRPTNPLGSLLLRNKRLALPPLYRVD